MIKRAVNVNNNLGLPALQFQELSRTFLRILQIQCSFNSIRIFLNKIKGMSTYKRTTSIYFNSSKLSKTNQEKRSVDDGILTVSLISLVS